MWQFLVGTIVGAVIGVFLLALVSAAPDPEDRDGGSGKDDEN